MTPLLCVVGKPCERTHARAACHCYPRGPCHHTLRRRPCAQTWAAWVHANPRRARARMPSHNGTTISTAVKGTGCARSSSGPLRQKGGRRSTKRRRWRPRPDVLLISSFGRHPVFPWGGPSGSIYPVTECSRHTRPLSPPVSAGIRREKALPSKVLDMGHQCLSHKKKSISLQKLPFGTEHASADIGRYFSPHLSGTITPLRQMLMGFE